LLTSYSRPILGHPTAQGRYRVDMRRKFFTQRW